MLKRTCKIKHFCARDSFNRKRELYLDSPGRKYRYEVWDPECSKDPFWDDSATEVKVFETDDKSLAQAFIVQGANRCKLKENGVCVICDMYEKRRANLKEGRIQPFFIISYSISRHYGGPEEGGWWYDWITINEVCRAFTMEEGHRHAKQLKYRYSQPKYSRHSCANLGEGDTYLAICYGERDPRWPTESTERPRYE